MPVPPKTRLGPYEIEQLLGSGGMGEVYRARHLTLQRVVAIKVVSELLFQDSIARERFQYEARAASKLSHPNICTIFDFGEWEGRQFLAMEYVDGQPLSTLLSRGPLPVGELLDLFIQLASGLDSAHSHGTIHRDIKPGNILVTATGQLKIVDFGLAKRLVPRVRAAVVGPDAETEYWVQPTGPPTSAGKAIGTIYYMSPEQARGEELDARSDLFSFGVTLYEAATGKRAFTGDTTATFFASLLKDEPIPALRLNPALPPQFGAIISKAIEKDKELRYQHASDVVTDLRRLKRLLETGVSGENAFNPGRRLWKVLLAGVGLLAIIGALWIWLGNRPLSTDNVLLKPRQLTAASTENPVFQSSLSPDGKMVAYSDEFGIHLQLISTQETWPLLRADRSPDGDTWWPVDWFPDGNHLLANSAKATPAGSKLATWVVSTHTGHAAKIREDAIAHSISPDGSLIAFTAGGFSSREEIWVMTAQGEAARMLVSSQNSGNKDSVFFDVRWSPAGQRLVFRKEDHESDQVSIQTVSLAGGPPEVLARDVGDWGDFCWGPDGRLLFASGSRKAQEMNLWELKADPKSGLPTGSQRQLTDWTGFSIENLSLSRDGTRLSFDKVSSQTDVFVAELRPKGLLEAPRRFTPDDYDDEPSAWAYDDKTLFFTTVSQGSITIEKQNIDEPQAEAVVTSSESIGPVRLTPDGSYLLYPQGGGARRRLMLAAVSGGKPQVFEFAHRGVVANVVCAKQPVSTCLAGTLDRARHKNVFWAFAPPKPEIRRLFETDYDLRKGLSWTFSPDGTRIGMNRNYPDHAEIEIYSLSGALISRVPVTGFNHFSSIDWAADGASWFVGTETATGCSLLRVYPDGRAQVLVNMRGRAMRTFAIPSPNGKRLAFLNRTVSRNVWIVDQSNRHAMWPFRGLN